VPQLASELAPGTAQAPTTWSNCICQPDCLFSQLNRTEPPIMFCRSTVPSCAACDCRPNARGCLDVYEHDKFDELSIVISSESHVSPACTVAEYRQQINMTSIIRAVECLDSFSCIYNTCSDPKASKFQTFTFFHIKRIVVLTGLATMRMCQHSSVRLTQVSRSDV
jgi:hypothetical protein